MEYFPNILFVIVLIAGIGFFARNVKRLSRNIKLGKDVDVSDDKGQRWKNMAKIALGQTKMVVRPVAGFLHIIVYVGFIIINIEVLEIVLDGILGTHRLFAPLGSVYDVLIGSFEVLAFLVIVAVTVFWVRRNIIRVRRFIKPEMTGWPKQDGNLILYIELVLMVLFLTMNGADYQLQQMGADHYLKAGMFPVSQFMAPLFEGMSMSSLILLERTAWWLHIIGILCFLNYLYYSKHLHILLAFPNTYYGKLKPKGQFKNLDAVTAEVKLMMDPSADPFAAPTEEDAGEPEKFGASDVTDLSWVQLLNSYTCTECGRCTDECPANQTGKKLSPRKIMMDTRDRLEEVGKNIDANKGQFVDDGKQLLDDYISREELWACTTCNACVQACPVSIDPLSIIMDMRQYLVMEQSAAPTDLNNMMGNIENNGAPWPFNQMDRLNWAKEE
ncbi:(Fe-S)-binding protein [Zobellia galactanivorans]|uniref:Possible ABC importer, permease component n=1 Tax=Zobellia galactanivorans (strain DSM 12802 / CCUG 47099 / CIP 106680 / NCIMB 13871 / Dsij) TaxID=63186 RepID=G0L822_ZOBGA|nr:MULTISPECIES: (Fe-S)-binding protein [Zobellia]MBU3024391.1 (Fe-S)-binding protein [Zobellia galactanivorans]MDO6807498.1 (Fe-S)-binding protein [Zobellia galactanivorans]OWW24209.1 Fe-S oxidoreductase [Zobellia sp. OII3]CAZ97880.1 Possible ABC importer, permease component [Zobellia galactanivorans]